MATDLSNWSKYDKNKNNIGKDYSRITRLPIGAKSEKEKQKLRIVTNIKTGDYKVLAIGKKKDSGSDDQDILIYSYDADTNKITINENKKGNRYYNLIFGSKSGQREFRQLNRSTKLDTYSLAQANTKTAIQQGNFEEQKQSEEDTKQLGKKKGYVSSTNVVATAPQTLTAGPVDNNTTKKKSSTTQSTVRSTNNQVPPIDMGTLSSSDLSLTVVTSKTSGDQQPSSTGSQYFRYPEGRIPNLGYDYIQITSYKYVPGLSLPSVGTGSTSVSNYIRTNNKQTTSGKILSQKAENIIQLPMTGGLSETSSVQWSSDTLSEINLIAGNIAYANITGGSNPVTAVTGALMDVIKTGQEGLLDADTKTQLMAYFAGQAASAPNFVQRATGKKINNNMELLFNGPQLRSFNFAFKLRPRTESESILCRNIIKSLKRDSAPKTSTTNLFLETPNVFQIEYIYQAQDGVTPSYTQHPFLNVIKPCALTSINVNYTPDGSYMTYETNGSMVGYDLNLTFQEIEPIYRSDQEAEYKRDNMGY